MSCSSDSDEEQNQVPEFDRSTILKNYAENLSQVIFSEFLNLNTFLKKIFLLIYIRVFFYTETIRISFQIKLNI